jgi:hypothetical protein
VFVLVLVRRQNFDKLRLLQRDGRTTLRSRNASQPQ